MDRHQIIRMLPFIVFVHIEKAGGITLHNLLHRCFPGYLSPHPNPRFGEFFSKKDLGMLQKLWPFPIQGLGGHRMAAFEAYEQVLDRPVFYFTFLRDPVSRYMSHINWQTSMMGMDWTIETFVEDPEKENYQCYRIAGRRDAEEARRLLLNKFHFVGLLERYDESLLILRQLLGLPELDIRYEQANTMQQVHRPFVFGDQTAGMQAQIRAKNAIDTDLYRLAKEELWPKYLAGYQGDLERDLAVFRQQKQGYRRPFFPYVKRKSTNFLLGRAVQPLIKALK